MAERTCSERGCNEEPYCRGLCASHYGKAYRRGTLQLLLSPARHSLSDVDRDQRTAICSVCGPVGIRLHGSRVECKTIRRESDVRHRRAKNPNYRPRGPLRKLSPEDSRSELLKRKFGITLDDYLRMLNEQGGACAICRRSRKESLAVDHDHRCCPGKKSCGKCVRGLLCRTCNLALGYVRDDPVILRSAIEYLVAAPAIAS